MINNTEKKDRKPMPRARRAKQFAPFDALTGLHERLSRAVDEHKKESVSDTEIRKNSHRRSG